MHAAPRQWRGRRSDSHRWGMSTERRKVAGRLVRAVNIVNTGWEAEKTQLFWVYGDPHRKYVDSWIPIARDQRCIAADAAAAALDLHFQTSWPAARMSFPPSSCSASCCPAARQRGSQKSERCPRVSGESRWGARKRERSCIESVVK